MICLNCSCEIGQQFTFQGVVVCGDCFKMVSHFLQRAQTEMKLLFLTYTDMLRVSLIRGQLRPPKLPDKGMSMPRAEFLKAMVRQMAEIHHEDSGPESANANGTVQGVRSHEDATVRQTRVGTDPEALRRRGELRSLPEVPTDPDHDGHRTASTTTADPTSGVDQTPRREP